MNANMITAAAATRVLPSTKACLYDGLPCR